MAWLFGGALAHGTLLDALATSSSFFDVRRASLLTVVVLVGLCIVQVTLRWLRPKIGNSPVVGVRSLGPKPMWALVGGVSVAWIGALRGDWVTAASADRCPPSFKVSVTQQEANFPAFSALMDYPEFTAPCEHRGLDEVNRKLHEAADDALAAFIVGNAEARADAARVAREDPEWREALRKLGLNAFGGQFLEFRCQTRMATTDLVSVLCLQTYFLGGAVMAHGAFDQKVFNFRIHQAGAQELTLGDVLVQGSASSVGLLALVRHELSEQFTMKEFIADRQDLWRAMEQGFGFTRQGMVFRFERYDSGPYIEGAREVLVPYARLGGILRSDGPQATFD